MFFITAVLKSSVWCSSVKTELYFHLMKFSIEYRDSQEYVVLKMKIYLLVRE
jgi:hypothetical protein